MLYSRNISSSLDFCWISPQLNLRLEPLLKPLFNDNCKKTQSPQSFLDKKNKMSKEESNAQQSAQGEDDDEPDEW
jgi:hypothetical protein